MTNTRLSDLSAGGAFAATDLVYVVELAGTGGVKKTGAQFEEYIRDTVAAFVTAGTGIGVAHNDSGNTLTVSTTITQYTDADAVGAVSDAITGNGMVAKTAADTFAARTITAPAAGISIANGDGVAGNPTLSLVNDLGALEGLTSTGIAVRTASDTWAQRSIAAGTAIGVTNGDGVAGNPTIAVNDAELTAIAGLTSAADKVPYFTGSGTAALATLTSAARSIIDDTSSAAMVQTLGLRETLSAARTYYVRTDGSDSNDGLTDSAGGAFLTWQHAIDVASSLDSVIYDVTIQWGSETGTKTFDVGAGLVAKTMVGAGKIILSGDTTTPTNVVLKTTGAVASTNALLLSKGVRTVYRIVGFDLKTDATGTPFGLLSSSGSFLEFGNVVFSAGTGTWSQQIRSDDAGVVLCVGNYTVSAGSSVHIVATGNSISRVQNFTITLSGTPNFSTAFALGSASGTIFLNGNTYSGSATGKRFSLDSSGVITTVGSLSGLPGNADGVLIRGAGSYLGSSEANSLGKQHQGARVTTGSVAASTAADITVTWPFPFSDTNYTVSASVEHSDAAGTLSLTAVRIVSKSTTQAVIQVFNQNTTTAKTGTVHALGIAD